MAIKIIYKPEIEILSVDEMDDYISEIQDYECVERKNHPDREKQFVNLEDLLKLKDKIRKSLIINSKCDCLIETTKYADIVDVLLWFELKKHSKHSVKQKVKNK